MDNIAAGIGIGIIFAIAFGAFDSKRKAAKMNHHTISVKNKQTILFYL